VDEKYFIKGGRLDWLRKYGEVKEAGGYVAFSPNKAKCLTVRAEPSWNCTYIVGAAQRGRYNGDGSTSQHIEYRQDGKANCVVASYAGKLNCVLEEGTVRKLTPIECERLQTVPDNYTSCISDNKRYAALGNGWTVDVICHILSPLKGQYD
jgi:site-specific DNA-cytosine methylase